MVEKPAHERGADGVGEGEGGDEEAVVAIGEGEGGMAMPDDQHHAEHLTVEIVQDAGENEDDDREPTETGGRRECGHAAILTQLA